MWRRIAGEASVTLVDEASRTERATIKHQAGVRWWGESNGGRFLATWCDDAKIRVFDITNGKMVGQMPTEGWFQVTVSRNGKHIAAINGSAVIVRTASGDAWGRVQHDQDVNDIAFSADGNYLASGGEDRQLKVWDVQKRKIISSIWLETPARRVVFTPDGCNQMSADVSVLGKFAILFK